MGFLAAFVRVYVLRSSSKLHPQRVPVRHAAPSSRFRPTSSAIVGDVVYILCRHLPFPLHHGVRIPVASQSHIGHRCGGTIDLLPLWSTHSRSLVVSPRRPAWKSNEGALISSHTQIVNMRTLRPLHSFVFVLPHSPYVWIVSMGRRGRREAQQILTVIQHTHTQSRRFFFFIVVQYKNIIIICLKLSNLGLGLGQVRVGHR
jgi:hypothetical protein